MPEKISDFNLPVINTEKLTKHIEYSIQAKSNIFLFGRRGSGKTEIPKQVAEDLNLHLVYLNLSLFERTDLGGYPNILAANQNKTKFVDFLLPQFYQPMLEGNKKVVALLDEADKADPSVWAPLYEFTQFHSINGEKMPNLDCILLTGNLLSEGGFKPPPPLLDRAEKYLLKPTATNWLSWATEKGKIHPSIVSFIKDDPEALFGEVDLGDNYADSSPRGWHASSDLVTFGEAKGWEQDYIFDKVAGRVGKQIASKYMNYYCYYQDLLPTLEDLYNKKDVLGKFDSLPKTKKLVFVSIAANRINTYLDNRNLQESMPEEVITLGNFFNSIDSELAMYGIRNYIGAKRIFNHSLQKVKPWDEILIRLGKK